MLTRLQNLCFFEWPFSQVNETEEIHSLKIINGDFCNTGGSVFFFFRFIFVTISTLCFFSATIDSKCGASSEFVSSSIPS